MPKFIVELTVPFEVGDATQSAIERQCSYMSNDGHSVEGDIDCFPKTDWGGEDELSVEITVSTSLDINAERAGDEAVIFWNFFLPIWTSDWFSNRCGEPKLETTKEIK